MGRKRTAIDEVIQALEEEENDILLADEEEMNKLGKKFQVTDAVDIDGIVDGRIGMEEY